MFEKLEVVRMAQALSTHSGARLEVVARNVANADTPGFKAQDLRPFAEVYRSDEQMRATRPGHIGAGPGKAGVEPVPDVRFGAPNGNTVSLEAEMVKSAEVRQSHDMALSIYRSVSDIVRTGLGRGR